MQWHPDLVAMYHQPQRTHQPLMTYKVVLSDEVRYILAKDTEEAAWDALALAKERGSKLIDVIPNE